MIDPFLPLVIGLVAGIEPPGADVGDGTAVVAAVEAPAAQEALPLSLGSGDDLNANREPEPQIPTGKYTTAIEIRAILSMTKNNWVGVR